MRGRFQETSKGGAIYRQTRVLTRGTCCNQMVATYDIHTCESYTLSLSLSLLLSFYPSSLSHLRAPSLTCSHYYCYFNYYLLFIIIYIFVLIIKRTN